MALRTKVREQFYHLDKRAVGFLSIESYEELLLLKQGGAKKKWQFAASNILHQRRVAEALKVAIPESSAELRAMRQSRMSHLEGDYSTDWRHTSDEDDDEERSPQALPMQQPASSTNKSTATQML